MPLFRPDFVRAEVIPSSNFGVRAGGQRPDCLLLHYTGMPTGASALARLCDSTSQVSCHYLVFDDGRIVQLVAEQWRAWHAGKSFWKGETDINSRSIGIEIAHPGHDATGQTMPPFARRQISAVVDLCADIISRNKIPPARILAHSDVAPGRKIDPGERFPWHDLHRAGIGHWVEPLTPDLTGTAASDDSVRPIQQMLASYGYGLGVSGVYDQRTKNVVTAFQRHFRPARVDGVADASTIHSLQHLLAHLPQPEPRLNRFFSDYDEQLTE